MTGFQKNLNAKVPGQLRGKEGKKERGGSRKKKRSCGVPGREQKNRTVLEETPLEKIATPRE